MKCVFLISTSLVTHLKSLMLKMSKDKEFEIYVFYDDIKIGKIDDVKKEYADVENMEEISKEMVMSLKKTYMFRSSPYDNHYTIPVDELMKVNYVMNVNYGCHIIKEIYHVLYNPNNFKRFYATFHECEENLKDYVSHMKKHCPDFDSNTAHVSGSTKVDYLMMNKNNLARKEEDTKNILFSFRWINNYNCSYNYYSKYFMDILNSDLDIKLIYRPHPLDTFPISNHKHPKFSVDRSYDYTNTFNNVDFFISDISTMIVDFLLYTRKPVILMKNKGSSKNEQILNSLGLKLLDAVYLINNQDELDKTMNDLIKGNDPKKDSREQIVSELNKYHASDYIVDFIKKDHIKNL